MALVLRKKSNTADGRFGRALRGLQRFPISALALLDRQSACLQSAALISKSAVSQTLFGLDQRLPRMLVRIQAQAQLINSVDPDFTITWELQVPTPVFLEGSRGSEVKVLPNNALFPCR